MGNVISQAAIDLGLRNEADLSEEAKKKKALLEGKSLTERLLGSASNDLFGSA